MIELPKTKWRPERLPIFIGYDEKEQTMFDICAYSIIKHASVPVEIYRLNKAELREHKIYKRKERAGQQSTDFAYTRFLIPYLMGFKKEWALFIDCDMLITEDILELFKHAEDDLAVMCVKHKDYTPKRELKMDGVQQTTYPRKNWSSVMLWNCGHNYNQLLKPETINTQTGAYLHRFKWLPDSAIGELPPTWNYLCDEGWDWLDTPNLIHYTNGHRELGDQDWNQNFEFSQIYDEYRSEMEYDKMLEKEEGKPRLTIRDLATLNSFKKKECIPCQK